MHALKVLRKILLYTVLIAGAFIVVLAASVYLFKDKIINQFIREANKQLSTPVNITKIDVSIFQHFPQLSIVFSGVYVEDSHEGQYPLLTASKISFVLNPIEVYRGVYTIKGLRIENSEVNLKINDNGDNNYTITKQSDSNGSGAVSFQLHNVELINTRVHYLNMAGQQDLSFTSPQLMASIASGSNIYNIRAKGQLTTEKINIEGTSLLAGKTFTIDSDIIYDDEAKNLTINPSTIRLKNSAFAITGTYSWKDKTLVDFKTEGKDTDIQTLFSLLPESSTRNLDKYRSKGDIYFKASLKGEISKRKTPFFSIDFGFSKATIYHPDYKTQIQDATLEGSFATDDLNDMAAATLVLKNIQGKLNNEPFAANFIIKDFKNPEVICDFKGRVDARSLLDFYPIQQIKNVAGYLLADVSFEGRLGLLKKKSTAQRVSTQGTIDLQNINLTYGEQNIALQHLNGSLQFNNNDLALSNVAGTIGNSDFLFNGFFKNIITFILFENQPIGIETDLHANLLDLDQLFAIGFGKPSAGPQQDYEFSISPNIYLNFNCDVKTLRYKKFHARNLKGDLLVKNQVAVSRNLSVNTMGGDLKLSAIVDANNHKAIDVVSTCKLDGINVDSVFYVFDNFNQSFIQDRHLKGRAYADVNFEMSLNQNLKLFPETLVADISAIIRNGELNNFEPMKKLNKFLDDESLSKLRFSDLKNDIHIENKTIYIPQMEIRSNVTDIKISGTHTFDQQIDYRLVTPLRARKKINEQEAQGAVEDDGSGRSKLFLKIVGTTDNYRILYDTEAVKKKIISDLKKEVQELKDAFKNKGTRKKKEAELQQDEYFEWDSEPAAPAKP